MGPFKIADNIYWVGAVDWNIRDFHGYSTYEGSTYNAYLILDEKITLIDTVKDKLFDQFISNIRQVIDPKKIDIVISNHTEMDHTGSLPRFMHIIGKDKPIYCSKMGKKNLSLHFGDGFYYIPVADGDKLSIGKRELMFIETRMLHWPDSMFTYIPEEKILFSSDAFGEHYATSRRFDHEVDEDELFKQAKKYYANILLPYSNLVLKLFEKVKKLNLEFNMICPDHGVIWTKHIGKIIDLYVKWAEQKPTKKALVVYDTMWHSTEKMAETIGEALNKEDIEVKIMSLKSWHRSDIITELMDAGGLLVGSPTLNNSIFPTISDFLTYMKGLRPKNKLGAAFGSYGWSGEAPKKVEEILREANFEIIAPALKIQYVPNSNGLKQCEDLGKQMAEKLKKLN